MAAVDIYLPIESATEWIRALSIPYSDIRRLTRRPLKWLRFATFAVCGAKGHLSTSPAGETADYENISFDDLAGKYYYTPDSGYHLVDQHAFSDRNTSSGAPSRRSIHREDIFGRDGACVITRERADVCQAAHIIPRSKGDEYITFVVHDRFSLYEQLPFSLGNNVDIDCTENGMLLSGYVHAVFDMGGIVFLKTPNFAMGPADVPRVEEGPIPANRTTMQYIVEPTGLYRIPPRDALIDWGDEVHPPPSILLDFVYGAAVVNRWKCDPLHDVLEERFKTDFSEVLAKDPKRSAPENNDPKAEPGDPGYPDLKSSKGKQKRTSSDASEGLSKAMDHVLLLSMLLKGTTPQMIAAQREKRRKEEELRSQEQSREKVQQWLNSVSAIVTWLFPE